MTKEQNLITLLEHFERVTEEKRQNEEQMNYNTKKARAAAKYVQGSYISKAGAVYSLYMYKKFEIEYNLRDGYKIRPVRAGDNWMTIYGAEEVIVYPINPKELREYRVKIGKEDGSIKCPCSMFETFGILCCHCLKVMLTLKEASIGLFEELPEQYIMKRWTTDARKGLTLKSIDTIPLNDRHSQMARYRAGMLEISQRLLSASHTDESFKAVMDGIRASLTENEHHMADQVAKGSVREEVQTDLTIKKKDNMGKGRAKRLVSINKQAREVKKRKLNNKNNKGAGKANGGFDDGLRLSL